MNSLDRDLVIARANYRAIAATCIRSGQPELAAPWLMRAARIGLELKKKGIL